MITHFSRLAHVVLLSLGLSSATYADDLSTPSGDVILTISGEITADNGNGAAAFDLEMLQALEATEITTDTNWTEGVHRFTGVRLDTLLEHVGASGMTISAVAINDYSVDIPTSDAQEDGPIVAYAMDGQPMSRRDKGPLWVIYPYASSNKFRTEVVYSRSIWQLDRMEIRQ